MKHKITFLLIQLLLLVGMEMHAQQEVSPYTADFNSPVDVSRANFRAATGWQHIVAEGDERVSYTYEARGGVDSTGCIAVGSQSPDYEPVYDLLVTPAVKGTPSIMVKSNNSYRTPRVRFFRIVQNADGSLSRGEEISASVPTITDTAFVQVVLPHQDQAEMIGIRGEYVAMDNFSADTACITLHPELTIANAAIEGDWQDADAQGNYTLTVKAKLVNTGELPLTAATEGYKLQLVNTTKNAVVSEQPLTATLAVGDSLSDVSVSATLPYASYSSKDNYALKECVSNTEVKAGKSNPIAYEVRPRLANGEGEEVSDINFGMSTEGDMRYLTLFNDGAAPLEITSVSVPNGFTTTLSAPTTVAAHAGKGFTIGRSEDVVGPSEGSLAIASADTTFALPLYGFIAEEGKWMETVETYAFPADMLALSSNSYWGTNPNYRGYEGYGNYVLNCNSYSEDRLASPLLTIAEGEKLYLDAARASSSSFLNIYYSPDRQSWTLLRTLSAQAENNADLLPADYMGDSYHLYRMAHYTIDGLPAGNYYLAFGGAKVYVDNIYCGTKVDVSHDLMFTNVSLPTEATVNHAVEASATLRNILTRTETADSYSMKLYVDGEPVAEAQAVDLESQDEADFAFSFTPHKAGAFAAYIAFEAADYELRTAVDTIVVAAEQASNIVQVGEANGTQRNVPVNLYDSKSESETIYAADELALAPGTKIRKLIYRGYNTNKNYTAHIKAWVENTADVAVSVDSLHATDGMTAVYDADYDFTMGGSSYEPADMMVIALAEPFVYTGGNLRVMFSYEGDSYASVYFQETATQRTVYRSHYGSGSLSDEDLEMTANPVLCLDIEKEVTTISGTVRDTETATPMVGVTVVATAGDVRYETVSDSLGNYLMPIYQDHLKYRLQAEAPGYVPFSQDVDLQGNSDTVNISLVKATGLTLVAACIPSAATVNNTVSATADVVNYTLATIAADSYTAQLVDAEGTVLATATPQDVQQDSTARFVFSFVPHKTDTLVAHMAFVADDFTVLSNADTIVVSAEEGERRVVVGTATTTDNSVPVNFYYEQSQSSTVYTAQMLGLEAGTEIKRIAYRGRNLGSEYYDANVEIWLSNTAESSAENPDTAAMTKVYSGTVEVEPLGSYSESVELISVPVSFVYTGENLQIVVKHNADETTTGAEFEVDNSGTSYYRGISGNLSEAKWYRKSAMPVVYLDVNTAHVLSGVVTDSATLLPVLNANVTLSSGDVVYTAVTDSLGAYTIEVVQAMLPYDVSVKAEGYHDFNTTLNFDGADKELNVQLSPIIDGIATFHANGNKLQSIYTLDGRKLSEGKQPKGVYIVNGKKRVVK